jgi:hypothetical protein
MYRQEYKSMGAIVIPAAIDQMERMMKELARRLAEQLKTKDESIT